MLQIAEKLLRRNPKYVSIVAPFVTCTLTILCGTGHVVYTILPIIYDVAIKNNIRPERPMAASSIGAQMGIIASPVSVAVVSLVAMLGNVTFDGRHLEFLDLLAITIPSTLIGILAIGIFSWFRGKDLDKDEEFQKFISVPENREYVYGDAAPFLGGGFGHFYNYAPVKIEYAINRFTMEAKRLLDVLDKQLAQHQFVAGDEYTIADMAVWPWFGNVVLGNVYDAAEFLDAGSYKHVQRWAKEIAARPAVKRGRIVNRTNGPLNEQLHERHEASDFDTNTEDKRQA